MEPVAALMWCWFQQCSLKVNTWLAMGRWRGFSSPLSFDFGNTTHKEHRCPSHVRNITQRKCLGACLAVQMDWFMQLSVQALPTLHFVVISVFWGSFLPQTQGSCRVVCNKYFTTPHHSGSSAQGPWGICEHARARSGSDFYTHSNGAVPMWVFSKNKALPSVFCWNKRIDPLGKGPSESLGRS